MVVAKDSPNFIANRIGTYGAMVTMQTMLADGYSIEEVDKMTGPAVGRPKTATLRTFDLVGLDVAKAIGETIGEAVPPRVGQLVAEGALGRKSGRGFHTY